MIGGDETFDVRRDAVARYFYWQHVLLLLAVAVCTIGIGLVAVVAYLLLIGPWLPRKQADVLSYRLDGSTLRVDAGVVFLSRKAIPLDRVTDIVLSQGPLMRRFGLWSLRMQTAGVGSQMPEGVLHGLVEPERVRDLLLEARDEAVSRRTGPGAA